MVAVSAGGTHTTGLRSDGTVVVAIKSLYRGGRYHVSGWTDIVAISSGSSHTIGLKADSTVVAVGDNGAGECQLSGWKDIRLP